MYADPKDPALVRARAARRLAYGGVAKDAAAKQAKAEQKKSNNAAMARVAGKSL